MQNNYDNREVQYAGFWARLAAYILDSMIVFAGLLAVRLMLSGIMLALDGTALGGNLLFHYDLKDIVLYLCKACYFILFTYYTGTTIGKKAMNLYVVYEDGEKKLSLLTVAYRETIGRFLSGILFGIGYLMIGADREKRGLHDILCDTRVIYAKKIKVMEVRREKSFPPYMTDMQTPQSGGYRMTEPDTGYRTEKPDTGYRMEKPDTGYRMAEPDGGYRTEKPDTGYRMVEPDNGYRTEKPDDGYRMAEPDTGYHMEKPEEEKSYFEEGERDS